MLVTCYTVRESYKGMSAVMTARTGYSRMSLVVDGVGRPCFELNKGSVKGHPAPRTVGRGTASRHSNRQQAASKHSGMAAV